MKTFYTADSCRCHRPATLQLLAAIVLSAPGGIAYAQQPVATSEAVSPKDAAESARVSEWQLIFRGIEMCEASTDKPRPLQVRAVRIDLREPGIAFIVTPSNGDEPLDTNARTTTEFLTEFKCQIAINGSAFDPLATQDGEPQDIVGLSLSRGDLYSAPNKYDAFLISKENKAWLDRSPIEADKAHNGLSGFYALLIDGRNNGGMKDRHPRSAIGVSKDGRYLILMTVDGRQKDYSEGTSTGETAELIRKLGAHHALNLDGGGSTTLVIEGPDGKPKILNRPSGGFQRRVANHLGVYTKLLPDKKPLPNAKDAPKEKP